jgi:hypothetical protein
VERDWLHDRKWEMRKKTLDELDSFMAGLNREGKDQREAALGKNDICHDTNLVQTSDTVQYGAISIRTGLCVQ